MEIGRIKWFNQSRGVGYIEHADGRHVYFYHVAVERFSMERLVAGVRVTFDMFTTRNGWEASNIMMLRE